MIVETLPRLEAGEIIPVPQDESQASHVKMMGKSLGRIDWNKDAVTIERLVRGLNSWPSAYTYFQEALFAENLMVRYWKLLDMWKKKRQG